MTLVMRSRSTPVEVADHALAQACDGGLPGAWERLRLCYGKSLRAFLRKRGASAREAEQLVDETWGALAMPPARGGARTRIGTYDGRGTLYSWLATILWRRLADLWRGRAGERPASDPAASEPRAGDPLDRVADAESRRLLSRALEEAWPRLTTRELQVVVLKYRHGLPQTEIARAMSIGTSRVSRLLEAAAERLRSAVQRSCGQVPGFEGPWEDVSGILGQLLARTAVSVDRPTGGSDAHG
jgi:RNA polymerase sigma factor (sigma-70 family)